MTTTRRNSISGPPQKPKTQTPSVNSDTPPVKVRARSNSLPEVRSNPTDSDSSPPPRSPKSRTVLGKSKQTTAEIAFHNNVKEKASSSAKMPVEKKEKTPLLSPGTSQPFTDVSFSFKSDVQEVKTANGATLTTTALDQALAPPRADRAKLKELRGDLEKAVVSAEEAKNIEGAKQGISVLRHLDAMEKSYSVAGEKNLQTLLSVHEKFKGDSKLVERLAATAEKQQETDKAASVPMKYAPPHNVVSANGIKPGMSMKDVEGQFDVLARKSAPPPKDSIHEVDLAMSSESRGLPTSFVSVTKTDGIKVTDGNADKVLAMRASQATDFKGKKSNTGETPRYYAMVLPPGFHKQYGIDLTETKMFIGGQETSPTPNAKQFKEGFVDADDPNKAKIKLSTKALETKRVELPRDRIYAIRAEKIGPQVHTQKSVTKVRLGEVGDGAGEGRVMSQQEFLRNHALAVVEFDENQKVLDVQILERRL